MRTELFGDRVRSARRGLLGLAAAGLLSAVLAGGAGAECGCPGAHDAPDLAAAGNGGTATAAAGGGLVLLGDLHTGGSAGGGVGVGDVWDGSVAVEGGGVAGATDLGVSVDGGVGVGGAGGGDANFAFAVDE